MGTTSILLSVHVRPMYSSRPTWCYAVRVNQDLVGLFQLARAEELFFLEQCQVPDQMATLRMRCPCQNVTFSSLLEIKHPPTNFFRKLSTYAPCIFNTLHLVLIQPFGATSSQDGTPYIRSTRALVFVDHAHSITISLLSP